MCFIFTNNGKRGILVIRIDEWCCELDKKRAVSIIIVCSILLLLIIVTLTAFKLYGRFQLKANLKSDVVVEYGNPISLEEIVELKDGMTVSVSPPLDALKNVGDYTVKVNINREIFDVHITIKDTTAPNLEVQDITRYIDEGIPDVKDFVTFSSDFSSFEILPIELESTVGEHEVEIVAQDVHGNVTKKIAKFVVKEDVEPPVFAGLTDITVYVGVKPDLYSGVSAVDERFGNVLFAVDDSQVSYNTPGEYTIIYSAKDSLGNESVGTRRITILKKPEVYMIENFPVYHQYPNYPNGCESIALYNLLRYYGVNVTPESIVEKLKKGDGPYWDGESLYGGNPEIEFVGDPRDIHGYGVFQKPILEVANQFKSGMIDYTGHSFQDVLALVKKGIPVQVWTSIGAEDTEVCARWTYTPTGETIEWICDLHSVVVIGYTDTSVFVSDSYTGQIEEYNRKQFERMYNLFGKRALYYPN